MDKILHKELSYKINGILFKVHNNLGRFCKHDQYCEAVESILKEEKIKYQREIEIPIKFNNIKLTGNILDFLIEDKFVLDVKCKKEITIKDYVQMKRYLRATGKNLGIIVNFAEKSARIKRILNKDPNKN